MYQVWLLEIEGLRISVNNIYLAVCNSFLAKASFLAYKNLWYECSMIIPFTQIPTSYLSRSRGIIEMRLKKDTNHCLSKYIISKAKGTARAKSFSLKRSRLKAKEIDVQTDMQATDFNRHVELRGNAAWLSDVIL